MNNIRTKEISLQQAVLQRITFLRDHLDADESDKEYIHRIRVDIKYLRAWLRLTRIKNDSMKWKEMDRNLSDQSKYLGQVRDRQAIQKTLNILSKVANSKKEKNILKLVKNKIAEKPDSEINLELAKQEIIRLLDIFDKNFVDVDSIEFIHEKLQLSFNKVKKFGDIVFSNREAKEEIHKFRKWVKHLYYQIKYIGGIFSANDKKELNKLGKDLGEAHDLLVLKDLLPELVEKGDLNTLKKLINKEIDQIVNISNKRFKKLKKLS